MPHSHNVQGRCLCKAVGIHATVEPLEMEACHCNMCRRWGGGPLLAVHCDPAKLQWEGEEHISIYDSSEWAQRGFCKQCGTHLFYRLKDISQYAIPAGLFDAMESFTFTNQVFIDQKPANYTFANATHTLTGEELFAKFGAE